MRLEPGKAKIMDINGTEYPIVIEVICMIFRRAGSVLSELDMFISSVRV